MHDEACDRKNGALNREVLIGVLDCPKEQSTTQLSETNNFQETVFQKSPSE